MNSDQNSLPRIVIEGLASQKKTHLPALLCHELSMTLMDYLRKHHLPIASSCGGKGQCRACLVNDHLLSCQITVTDFLSLAAKEQSMVTIQVSYL